MSGWASISGSVGIMKAAFEYELAKDGSIQYHKSGKFKGTAKLKLPYPEEQFRLGEIEPFIRHYDEEGNKNDTPGFRISTEITSFPIIKREVKELLKGFPVGEQENIFCMLEPVNFYRSWAGQFMSPQTEKLFQDEVLKKFSAVEDWKVYTRFTPTELNFEKNLEDAVLCIHDSIRDCSAKETYDGLIKVLTDLITKNYTFDDGYFCITDYYTNYLVSIRGDSIKVSITDKGTTTSEYYAVVENFDISTRDKKYPLTYKLVKEKAKGVSEL